jgi:hypothetical protein
MTLLNNFDFLSDQPERRSVELSFLHRILESLCAQSVRVIEAAAARPLDAFPAQYKLMHGPVFDGLAKAMTQEIPDDEDFGPFRSGA